MEKEKSNNIDIDNFKSTADLTSNPGFQSTLSVATKSDEKAYDPFEHRNVLRPNTILGSILHLLKSCLGTGVLAMPAAFKNAGLIVGTLGTMLTGFLCTYTVHVLVKTSQEICVEAKKPSLSFSETCGLAFTYGPKRVQSWGPTIKVIGDVAMALCYVFGLCVYVVFIGSSLKEVADGYGVGAGISVQSYCAMTLVPLVLICQVRTLKFLVPFSAVANVCLMIVFAITLYYIFTDLPPVSDRKMVASVSTWPLFFSTAVFAMEGIGVVMPIENEMARPQKFLGCPGVLNISMVIVVSLFIVVGFFGYVQFGDAVKGSITLNLPEDDLIAQSTKLLMAFVIFLSFTIQFYVPMEVVTRRLKDRKTDSHNNLIQVAVRTAIVCFAVGVGSMFPNLELVISFVGAIFFSTFGLVVPALVETVYRWDRDLGPMNYILWKNVVIGVLGIVALVSGAYVSGMGMIDEFFRNTDVAEILENVLESNTTLTV